jgi:hypothetical protein
MVKNRQKHFPPKKIVTKNVFVGILEYKNFLILKMNIFLDFSFLKKQ